jgi:hypothetical protein
MAENPAEPVRPTQIANNVVFLVDVDDTLLDNDRIQDDLRRHLEREFGAACRDRYWAILEALMAELGYRDYLGALQRYRVEYPHEPHLLSMSSYLVDYPFANRYVHKEQELDDVARHYPAGHYVLVDDKMRILTAVKQAWGDRVTTVFPRQGKFAHDPRALATYPPPDLTVNRIDELLDVELAVLLPAGRAAPPETSATTNGRTNREPRSSLGGDSARRRPGAGHDGQPGIWPSDSGDTIRDSGDTIRNALRVPFGFPGG